MADVMEARLVLVQSLPSQERAGWQGFRVLELKGAKRGVEMQSHSATKHEQFVSRDVKGVVDRPYRHY